MDKNKPNAFDKKIRDDLASLDEVPVPAWNPEATWDRLEATLHPQQKRRGIIWWWYAAAGIVVLLSWTGWRYWQQNPEGTLVEQTVPGDSIQKQNQLKPANDSPAKSNPSKTIEQNEAVAGVSANPSEGELTSEKSVSEIQKAAEDAVPRAEGNKSNLAAASVSKPAMEATNPEQKPESKAPAPPADSLKVAEFAQNDGASPTEKITEEIPSALNEPQETIQPAIAAVTTPAPTVFQAPSAQLKRQRKPRKKMKVGFGWASQKLTPEEPISAHKTIALAVKTKL